MYNTTRMLPQYVVGVILIGIIILFTLPTIYNNCNNRKYEIINTRKYEIVNI
jgi:hypothetical protein